MSEFQVNSLIKANKDHKCLECDGKIAKGNHYQKSSGAFDGQGFAYKTCIPCSEARTWLDSELRKGPFGLNFDEGIEFGGLRSELLEYLSESNFECLDGLRYLTEMVERKAMLSAAQEGE